MIEAIIKFQNYKVPRPYETVKIDGKTIRGLLDSVATASLLGKNCREIVQDLGEEISQYVFDVSTKTECMKCTFTYALI